MTESGEAIQPRIVEIIEEFHDDRDQSGELQALTNLARALVKAEAASAAPQSTPGATADFYRARGHRHGPDESVCDDGDCPRAAPPEREVPAARIIRQVRRALGPLDDPATYGDISYEGPRHADCSVEGCPEHWPVAAPPEPPRPITFRPTICGDCGQPLDVSHAEGVRVKPIHIATVAAPERLPLNVERLREAMSNVMWYRDWDEGYPEQVAAEYARLSESGSPALDRVRQSHDFHRGESDAEERVIGRKCIACDNILIGGECPIHGNLTLRGESDSPTPPLCTCGHALDDHRDTGGCSRCDCTEAESAPTPPPDCVGTHAPSEVCPQCDDGSKDLNASAMSGPTPPGEER